MHLCIIDPRAMAYASEAHTTQSVNAAAILAVPRVAAAAAVAHAVAWAATAAAAVAAEGRVAPDGVQVV